MRHAVFLGLALACAQIFSVHAANTVPDENCPVCGGLGIVPNLPYKPYVRIDSQAPNPNIPPAWHYCDKCQKGMDTKAISADMKECQDRARAKHKEGFEKSGVKLELIMTPFVSFHSNLPMVMQKKIPDALEKCAGAIQANLKTMRLLKTRPDTHDIYLFNNDKFFDVYVDKVWPEAADKTKNTGEIFYEDLCIKKKAKEQDENYFVDAFATMQLLRATGGNAPYWLKQGFSAYCENKVFGTNTLAHLLPAEVAKAKDSAGNWVAAIRSKAKEVRKWDELFQVQLADAKVLDSMAEFSIVSYLIALDPMRFDKFIQNITAGDNSTAAIEKAYGRKIAELQSNWVQWTQTQR